MPRLVFDFPSRPGSASLRRTFSDPVEVVSAADVGEVMPCLLQVARRIEDGLTAAGYLAYEAAPAFDPASRVRSPAEATPTEVPLVWFGLFEGAGDPVPSPAPTGRGAPADPLADPLADPFGPWEMDVSQEAFAASVRTILRAIEEGETYQVNYTTRMRAPFHGDPSALYERLRASQGAGYHALLELGRHTVVSASPELFFQLRGRELTTRPMKGTSPRGRWLEEDRRLARRLRTSEKERAENRMIVDLLRNDVGRVAETGSVEVPRVFEVERYRTVLQMTSTITGRLPPGRGFVDVLGALFPCGSVTGAPKIRTMHLISELEPSPRGIYCGAAGFVEGGTGAATFNVPIRTVSIDRGSGVATYGVGSGITWGSTAEGEYEEVRAKARILSEPWPEFDLLESLRLEDGRFHRLERHLARMKRSALYFDRPLPEESVRAALESVAATRPRGLWKARLTVSPDGLSRIDLEPLEPRPPEAIAPRPASPFRTSSLPADSLAANSLPPDSLPPGSANSLPTNSLPPGSANSLPANALPPGSLPRVALAAEAVDSDDRFLYHKTTHRAMYDAHRANYDFHRERQPDLPDILDVLLWNERGEVTEFTRGNVVVEIDGRRRTPPRSAGLLAGCFREELLELGIVEEATLLRSDLPRAERVWLVNSVRGWVPVKLVAPCGRALAPVAADRGAGNRGPGAGDGGRGTGTGGRMRRSG